MAALYAAFALDSSPFFATIRIMIEAHPIVNYCREKGKEVDFLPGDSGTLFDATNGYVRHEFEYRGEQRLVTVPFSSDLPKQKLWNRLLYHIRKEKEYVNALWEHGSPV